MKILLKIILILSSIICFISVVIGSYIQHSGASGYGKYLIIFSISFVVLLTTTLIWNIKINKDQNKDKEF